MKLQTSIPIETQRFDQIDYDSKLLSLGSCFSEHIGNKLSYYKFQNTVNPFGILFNPIALENCLTNAINEKSYEASDLFFHMERYHCYDGHSDLSDTDESKVLNNLNSAIETTHDSLKSATHILITLGTSWVYRHIESDRFVANCHKVPQKKFSKELLSIDAIYVSMEACVELIRSLNPNVVFIFTVSPVRHLKDGFIENSRSKAHLIAAIQKLVEDVKGCHYFPSYEIMMDELRDYRFYSEDMIHPNSTAIDYIWEKFKETWLNSDIYSIMETVEKIQKGLAHRPFNENSDAHNDFLKRLEELKQSISAQITHVKF